MKLVIIADDYTGALDTGVKLAETGIPTNVISREKFSPSLLETESDVLVVNTETRHFSTEEAYRVVNEIAQTVSAFPHIHLYKKTDSMLRGNIGSELTAVLKASRKRRLVFVPALPQHGRVTVGARQFSGGRPIDEWDTGGCSERIDCSYIPEIIANQSSVPIRTIPRTAYETDIMTGSDTEIVVYDAETKADINRIAARMKPVAEECVFAGCAGFAEELPFIYDLKGKKSKTKTTAQQVAVICGSIHPITQKQLTVAQNAGIGRLTLTAEQIIGPAQETETVLADAAACLIRDKGVIIDASDLSFNEKADCAARHGIPAPQMRGAIAQRLGYMGKCILDLLPDTLIALIGGDTMAGFIRQMDVQRIVPEYEILPGCVMSQVQCKEKSFFLVSKSGGFGGAQWVQQIIERIKSHEISK